MLMGGNVGVNRVKADCLDFTDNRTITEMAFQSPGGFEAPQKRYSYQRTWEVDKKLTLSVFQGERFHLQLIHYGFLCRKMPIQPNGMDNGIPGDLRPIVSFPQQKPIVRLFINKKFREV